MERKALFKNFKMADIVLVDSNLGKNQYFETYNRNNSQILEYIAPDYIRKSSKKFRL